MLPLNLLILVGLFLLPFTVTNAASKNYNDNLIEFSLSAEHQDTQFKFSANNYATRFDIVGINWYEPLTPYFHAGIEAGGFNMSQTSNNLSSAQFTKGQYAGFLLRFIPLETHYLIMNINLNYRYSQSDGVSLNQSSEFAWHQSLVSLEALLRLSEVTRLFMEAEYHRISGEQRDSGTITQISRFSEQNNLGYRLGFEFRSERNGIVRLNWLTGYRDGAQVQFIHKF